VKTKNTKQKALNAAIFFTILLWLLVYFLMIRHHLLVSRVTPVVWVVLIVIQVLIFLLATYLVPAFEFISKYTGKIGSFIFGMITTVVYYFILTPIAVFKRLTGKPLLHVKIDKTQVSYYEQWESSVSIEKQY